MVEYHLISVDMVVETRGRCSMCTCEFKRFAAAVVTIAKSVLVCVCSFSSWHVLHSPRHTAWIHVCGHCVKSSCA